MPKSADGDNPGKAGIGFRLRPPKNSPARAAAMDQLTVWTRERFALPEEAPVMVCELACTTPGCPPIETLIAFWTETGERRHFKVFKPLESVSADDLPPSWMKNSLCSIEGEGFSCC
jgi:nitrate reductase delta subunit